MKLLIGKLLIFVLLFWASDFLLGSMINSFHLDTNNINLRNANYGFLNYQDNDVLFFGASEVSHTFISNKLTEDTGLSSYNLASDGCGILYQYALLETILEKHTPKVIVISSYQLNEQGTDYLTRMYPYYEDNSSVKKVIDDAYPREHIKLELEGYVYNSQIIRIFDGRSDNKNGYVPLPPRKTLINTLKFSELPPGENYAMSEQTIKYFNKFVDLATSSGASVYIYIPPVLEEINQTYLSKIVSISKNTNTRLIDFSRDSTFLNSKMLFNDKIHLNHEGAKIMIDKFVDILKEDNVYQSPSLK